MRVTARAMQTPGERLRQAAAAGAWLAAAGALGLAAAGASGGREARAAAARPAAAATASPTPATPDSRHYRTNELDVRPGITVQTQPAYPARAARENVSGKAIVQLYIDSNGAVEKVTVERATPAGYGFDDSAARAFRAARFSPGIKDGKRVRVQMRIEVSFDAPTATPASSQKR